MVTPPQVGKASPKTLATSDKEANSSASIRCRYLRHESDVKSIATIYDLVALLLLLPAITLLISGLAMVTGSDANQSDFGLLLTLLGTIVLIFMGLFFYAAAQLRKLKPEARYLATFLSGLGFLLFPIGTLINGYLLYRLWSEEYIFTPRYATVIAETPEYKPRTSLLVWAMLGISVALLIVLTWVAWEVETMPSNR